MPFSEATAGTTIMTDVKGWRGGWIMTQKNSFLPDGYRFWLDDKTELEPITKKNLSVTSETEPDDSCLESQQISNEIETISVEENADELCSNDFNIETEEFVEQQNHQPISVDDINESSPAPVSTSGLADFWLHTLRQDEQLAPVESSESVQHSVNRFADLDSSSFWRCNSAGSVIWFLDQNGLGWSKSLTHPDLFSSDDGGERAATAVLTADGCRVEDFDGTILKISCDGTFAIENRRKSREQNVRSLMDVFFSVDTNGDERLSLAEIESALRSCNEKDRSLINSLKTHFKRIEWSRRGMFGQVAEGLSLREILDFTSTGGKTSEYDIDETLLSQIEAVIDFIDHNRCGFVDRDGLAVALNDLTMPARLRRSIEVLIKRLGELTLLGAYGFSTEQWRPTRQAIRVMLCDLHKQTSSSGTVFMPASLEMGADIDQGLYAAEDDPVGSITIGAINNCVEAHQSFMSIVAAAIVHNPEVVIRTIRRSDNGAFIVTFMGDRSCPIRVLAPAQMEIHQYGLSSKCGVWALVLARGFAQYAEQRKNAGNPIGSTHEIAQLLIGNEVRDIPLREQCTNELAKLIDRLWAQDKLMVLCRFPHEDKNIPTSVLRHTCAITGWEPQTGVVSLANPQSQASELVSIDSLQTSFDSLLYSI